MTEIDVCKCVFGGMGSFGFSLKPVLPPILHSFTSAEACTASDCIVVVAIVDTVVMGLNNRFSGY